MTEILSLRLVIFVLLSIFLENQCYSINSIKTQSKLIQSHSISTALNAMAQPFNPFTQRRRNTRVRWFETDLESFYQFVENQPLLNATQELKYGKAIQMWAHIERTRERMQQESTVNERTTDSDLAMSLGCSTATIEKMAKYANIAKIRLVSSNMKLVLAIVSRYRTSSISNSELIAEGARGLARAALRYDHTKGFRFATYATWYVHQAIAEYVRLRKHPAKMPSRYLLLHRKIKQFSSEFETANRRSPTAFEIAEALRESQFDVNKVLTMHSYPLLLNAPLASNKIDSKERTVEDVVASTFRLPSSYTSSRDLRSHMETMMQANLNDVERDILRLRLGLDDGHAKAVKEVGRKFHISWKQVRTVEKVALSKLSSSDEISEFISSYHSV